MVDLFGRGLELDAVFHGKNCRLSLSRSWGPGPRALVIGCNPSDASHLKEDPTSRWWTRWFTEFGFGGYEVVNLYPFITSSPKKCRQLVATIGSGAWDVRDDLHFVNLPHVVAKAKQAHKVFVCWGGIAWDSDWINHVVEEIQSGIAPYPDLWCWGTTASGAPKHPLARGAHRMAWDQPAIIWKSAS
ncbi:DUF1643 domain-containing protein [Neorhizobium sp. LMR1-1-1.1]